MSPALSSTTPGLCFETFPNSLISPALERNRFSPITPAPSDPRAVNRACRVVGTRQSCWCNLGCAWGKEQSGNSLWKWGPKASHSCSCSINNCLMSKFSPPPSPNPSKYGDNRALAFLLWLTNWGDNSELTRLLSEQNLFTAVCDPVISLEWKMQKKTVHFFRS